MRDEHLRSIFHNAGNYHTLEKLQIIISYSIFNKKINLMGDTHARTQVQNQGRDRLRSALVWDIDS